MFNPLPPDPACHQDSAIAPALALAVMNFALLGMLYYVVKTADATRQREVALIYQQQNRVSALLSRCDAK